MSARSIPSLAVLLAFFFVLLAVVSAAPVPELEERGGLGYSNASWKRGLGYNNASWKRGLGYNNASWKRGSLSYGAGSADWKREPEPETNDA